MKKILTVSLVAMMAVSGARADLASTAYVDTVAAAAAAAADAKAQGAVNVNTSQQTAIDANTAQIALKANQTDLEALQGTVNTLGDTYALDSELESAVTSLKNTEIKAAADAAAAAQATADKKQNALTAGDFIQIEEGTGANQGKTFIKTTYTAGANVDISDTGVISATDTVYDDTEVRGLIGDNATAIATNKADIDAINGGTTGIAGMVVSGNPTEGAGKYALTAIVNQENIITGYKWELIDRTPND